MNRPRYGVVAPADLEATKLFRNSARLKLREARGSMTFSVSAAMMLRRAWVARATRPSRLSDPPTGTTGEWLLKPARAFIQRSSVHCVRRVAGRDRPVACATHFLDGGIGEVWIDQAAGESIPSTPLLCALPVRGGEGVKGANRVVRRFDAGPRDRAFLHELCGHGNAELR